MMMSSAGRSGNRYPFTPSQWQELEHQALIYKYMASGTPIPSDLILPIRRSFLLDTALATAPSLAFSPQPSLGWGCFQVGFGRKAEDPEPGRCRRTDGKKWRCSKEAYPDSKYCEKHMHRGKNRSRKPVEMSLATPPSSSSSSLTSSSSSSFSSSSNSASTSSTITTRSPYASSLSMSAGHAHPHPHDAASYHHLLYPYATSVCRPQMSSPFHVHLDAHAAPPPPQPYYSVDHKDYRYAHGMKEVDEHAFFSDRSERETGHAWQFKPLGMGGASYGGAESKQSASLFPSAYGSSAPYAIDLSKDDDDDEKQQQQQQHCFVLGADLRLDKPLKMERDEAAAQKPLRHFFDEWPHEKSKDSWMGLEGETQLSISIPMAATHGDLHVAASRFHNDE